MNKDRIYSQPQQEIVDFRFDEQVTRVFPDMIRRSVPGYTDMVALTGLIAERHAQPQTRCYDLGCSLGATTLSMRRRLSNSGCTIVAVDNSAPMIDGLRQELALVPDGIPVTLVCSDLRDVEVENASVVVLNFTLQFIPPDERIGLLRRIRAGMVPGGVLVVSEKIKSASPAHGDFAETMHRSFKRANGYSEMEISQKRAALERVLIPETIEAHQARFAAAGFRDSMVWFRCFNFASLVAFS